MRSKFDKIIDRLKEKEKLLNDNDINDSIENMNKAMEEVRMGYISKMNQSEITAQKIRFNI